MANLCFSEITITHDDVAKLRALYENIEKWVRHDALGNGTYHWLGNIVLNAQIGSVDSNDHDYIKCRGDIIDICFIEDSREIFIATATAWTPKIKIWKKLVDKYLPDAEVTFRANEPGCEIFVTNNFDLAGQYLVDACESFEDWIEEDSYEIWPKEKVVSWLQKGLKTDCNDIDTLLEMFKESNASGCAYINMWKYMSLDEAATNY